MSWRVVVISNVAKLDLKLNHLVVRKEKMTKIPLSEIHTLIIESTAVSTTAALLVELMKRKIKVIFCDEKRNPNSELIPYYGSHDTSAKDRKSTRLNSSHANISYAVFCLKKKKILHITCSLNLLYT